MSSRRPPTLGRSGYDAQLCFDYYRKWYEGGDERDLWWSVLLMAPRLANLYRGHVKSDKVRRDLPDLKQDAQMELVRSLARVRPDLTTPAAWSAWTRKAAIHVFHHWLAAMPTFHSVEDMLPHEPMSGSLSPAHQHQLLEQVREAEQVPAEIEDRLLSRVRFGQWIQLVGEIHRAQARGANTRMLFKAFRVPASRRRFLEDYTKVRRRLAMREIYDERNRTTG